MLARRLLLVAALALMAFGGANYLHSLRDLVPVVVTTAYIPAHTRLSPDQLAVIQVHRDAVKVLAPHPVPTIAEAVGLVTQTEFRTGDVIRREPWLVVMPPRGADPTEARYYIPEGMHLASVHVDSAGAVGGRVVPGDRVDVVFTTREASGATSAETLLQGVEVFAVGTRGKSTHSDSTGQDVTLLVTPQQAQTLALTKRSGGSIDLSIAPPSPTPVDLPSSTLPGTAPATPQRVVKQSEGAAQMDAREKQLYHQIHPLKLMTDWGTGVVSLVCLWRHQLAASLLVGFVPSMIVTLIILRVVTLEPTNAPAWDATWPST